MTQKVRKTGRRDEEGKGRMGRGDGTLFAFWYSGEW
jgi:hypothetical protein